MRCNVCGREADQECCGKCHFVHDHWGWLDDTTITDGRMRSGPPPWTYSPRIKRWIDEAKIAYGF